MDRPVIALAARLICSSCGYPAGYFHLHNPAVRPTAVLGTQASHTTDISHYPGHTEPHGPAEFVALEVDHPIGSGVQIFVVPEWRQDVVHGAYRIAKSA